MEQKPFIVVLINWSLRTAADGIIAIIWHFWMILTLRAQVAHVADRVAPMVTFFVSFLTLGVLRWNLLNDIQVVVVAANLLVYLIILWVVTIGARPRLLTLALGTSAAVDLGCIALQLAGVPGEVLRSSMWCELFLLAVLVVRYRNWCASTQHMSAQK